MKRHGGLLASIVAWTMPVGVSLAEPKKVVTEPSCVDLGVGMLEWASPDGRAGRRIKVAEWLDSKEVKRTHIELLLPLDKDAAKAGKKPRRMHVVITRLPAPHPGLWKDDVPAWDKNSNQHGDPSYVSAKVKREGFQQLIDVADGNEKVLRSLEWYGDWGELEPNQPKQPVLLEWMSGYENGYEIVRPRFIHSADGYFRGFEGYRLMGKGWEFAPKFHAHLLNPDRTMMLEFLLSLKGEPELQDRKPGKGTLKLAEENYRLLREDFPGEAYRGVAETVRRAREVVKTLRWRDAQGRLVPAS
jgi:hypothetical protein